MYLKKCHINITIYHYTSLHIYFLSRYQADSNRFQSQSFHCCVIQVIVSYTDACFGETKTQFTSLENPCDSIFEIPQIFYILLLQVHAKYAIRSHHNSKKVI